ncbi:MAG TPA: glycosyltransferase family 4 protein [Solirubrobacteraceae bacterium]
MRDEIRDLLVTPHTPVLRAGHTVRTYGVARALAARRGLDLLYVLFDAPGPDASFCSIPGIALHEAVPSRGPLRALAYGRARMRGVPPGIARGASWELTAAARRLAAEPRRGRVIADGPIAAAALLGLARRRPVIYNAHNLESGFRQELADERPKDRRRLEGFERRLLELFAETWMVSEPDIAGARRLCPGARLRYAPNVVDVAAIVPTVPALAQCRILFVASFFYEPNRIGLRFLLDEVMPAVWAQRPEAKLTLVGPGLDEPPSEDPRVEALGFVEDLDAVYARSTCAAVPLLVGGGTPLKLIEALAHGLPAIATPRASAGLQLRDGEHCLIAEGPEAFAEALLRALADGMPEMASHGRELAQARYSIETLSELLAP